MSSIADNIKHIHASIEQIKRHYDLLNHQVELIAVSKYQPVERICQAIESGQYVFGENRVQEALEKWPKIKEKYAHLPITLHLIGPLQTNKVKEAVKLFDVIETIDRKKLVLALKKEMQKQDKYPVCLVQVNTGEEGQKSGVLPQDIATFMAMLKSEQFSVSGLMCIPPVGELAALHFALLCTLAKQYQLPILSMGMSGDYKEAVTMGSTHIRIGTAIFGERQ